MGWGLRAGAVLPLSGRYAFGGRMAAEGLIGWADSRGVDLELIDSTSDDDQTAARFFGGTIAELLHG